MTDRLPIAQLTDTGNVVPLASRARQALQWNATAISGALDILLEIEALVGEQTDPQHQAMQYATPDGAELAVKLTKRTEDRLRLAIKTLDAALTQSERALGLPVTPVDPSGAMSA